MLPGLTPSAISRRRALSIIGGGVAERVNRRATNQTGCGVIDAVGAQNHAKLRHPPTAKFNFVAIEKILLTGASEAEQHLRPRAGAPPNRIEHRENRREPGAARDKDVLCPALAQY